MVDLSGMQRVLEADPETGLVTVDAGIKLHALGPQLAEHGLALENQGDIDAQAHRRRRWRPPPTGPAHASRTSRRRSWGCAS